MAEGKTHERKTKKAGFERLTQDKAWHSSVSLRKFRPNDILLVKNTETEETSTWRVTRRSVKLGPKTAEKEWNKSPVGSEASARKNGFYPYVLRDLEPASKKISS